MRWSLNKPNHLTVQDDWFSINTPWGPMGPHGNPWGSIVTHGAPWDTHGVSWATDDDTDDDTDDETNDNTDDDTDDGGRGTLYMIQAKPAGTRELVGHRATGRYIANLG